MNVISYLYNYCDSHAIIPCFGPEAYDTILLDQSNLDPGQLILLLDCQAEENSDNVGGTEYSGTMTLLRKSEDDGNQGYGTISTLDESYMQKYERRLIELEGMLKSIFQAIECELNGEFTRITYSHQINRYDINADGVQADFRLTTYEEMDTVSITNIYQDLIDRIAELEEELSLLEDRNMIIRGKVATILRTVTYTQVDTSDFVTVGDLQRKQLDFRLTGDPELTSWTLNGVEYQFDRAEGQQYGVIFYYKSESGEFFTGQGLGSGNLVINIPVSLGVPESLEYGEMQESEMGHTVVIDGRARIGTSEDTPAWRIWVNHTDSLGHIFQTDFYDNQSWSEFIERYE